MRIRRRPREYCARPRNRNEDAAKWGAKAIQGLD
jgi:hypothetical protein